MRLKKFILFTLIFALILVAIGLYFNTPIAYIPQDASGFEYVMSKILFATTIAVVALSIFVHIKNNTRLDNILKKKKRKLV